MSNKVKTFLRVACLFVALLMILPAAPAAHAAPLLPPVGMFQLPWELGTAWVALDGFDNGTRRALSSPHNYLNGGAIDFAPHTNMRKGEDTSNAWVTAAAEGIVVQISKCHLILLHADNWLTEYQHLANFQVKLGDSVQRNQRLAIIANASASQPVCLGSVDTDTPHLHFTLRPNMVGATFAGWEFKYNSLFNITSFVKNGTSVGLFKPLLNLMGAPATATPVPNTTPTSTPPTGPYVSTSVDPGNISIGGSALVTVSLHNVPVEGYTSAEFTCTYNASLITKSNILAAGLFGPDAAVAISEQTGSFIVAIAGSRGSRATTSGVVFTFNVTGQQAGLSSIECTARVSQGTNTLTNLPSVGTSLSIHGLTPTSTPSPPQAFTPTPTAFAGDWLAYTNSYYGFQFRYPPRLEDLPSQDNNYARIDLPFVQGTNLSEKYLEVIVRENVSPCLSPLQTNLPAETVIINGITFQKQTGNDAGAGNLRQWTAYSTLRGNVCVSLDFILHSLNPGNFSTPPVVFDYAAESAVFGQIVSTYAWLAVAATPTPLSPGDLVPSLSFVPVANGLSQPVFVTHAGDGSGRLFVLERAGRIRIINSTGSLLSTPYLDITSLTGSSGTEEGLLGLAFHPNYESNGLFFIAYTNTSGDLVLAKYSVSSDPNAANPASAVNVLTIPHPTNSNHNGGMLAFGSDGYLYWSTGDGGGGGDVPNNAQNINSLLGKILRLDVISGSPYAIPPDNPFVGVSLARTEIWDYGFRNPWRFSFDRLTTDLYIGDVGEGNREEIDFEPASASGGLNYGWRVMEGSLCFNPSNGCDTSGKILPVAEYVNDSSTCAVTGGYVYRGSLSPQMTGIYFFGDYCGGQIWGLLRQSSGSWATDLITDTSFFISSFGEDEGGELYLTDYVGGSVQRVFVPGSTVPTATPTQSSVPVHSPTPTTIFTPFPSATPVFSPTATNTPLATLTGKVIASKVVTVRLYDLNDTFVASVNSNPDGTFRLDVAPGTYTIVATANGFLRVQDSISLAGGENRSMPEIALLAGDIDDDNAIDQFDAMTIGFSYGSTEPPGADLNSDGIINVLDLELLAKNYRKTGPVPWQ